MDDKLNSAMNEIDDSLVEEAALAGSAERRGLKLARNIGLSVCGAAAAAAALTFGISHHMASLPEKVDLLPAESIEANNDISDTIAERALRELSVERVDVEDVDPVRLSQSAPYFIEAGNRWRAYDNDSNLLSKDNVIVIMDCGGYWLEYDATTSEGFIYELLDVRGALAKAENVLEASLTDVHMGTCDADGYYYTVTARFDNGKCLHYSLSCDTNHEQWTMKLLSDEPDYLDNFISASVFFREERAGVYDSVRFNDLGGAYICDNNGDIRVVKYTPDGYSGYLPFGGKEYIYTVENTETGSRRRYCVKENGDAVFTTNDFLTVIGEVEHREDIHNIVLPSWNIVDDEIAVTLPEIGASERYHLGYAPDYTGLAPCFVVDKDGKVFLFDYSWLYPCTVEMEEAESYNCIITVNFYPEGRETPDNGDYLTEVPMKMLINDDLWTLAIECELFIDDQGETKRITLYKGTEFTTHGGGISGGIPDYGVSEEAPENPVGEDNSLMTAEKQQELNEQWAELIASVPDPSFLYPVGGDYAIVEHVYGHAPDSGYYGHMGIDIGVALGEPVLAATDGEVILAEWYYGYGNCVMIQHDNGVVTVYGHCSELYVSEGDTVTRGQAVAAAGASGQATSPHLHFEVRINDECVDPTLFEYQILLNGELSERTTFN